MDTVVNEPVILNLTGPIVKTQVGVLLAHLPQRLVVMLHTRVSVGGLGSIHGLHRRPQHVLLVLDNIHDRADAVLCRRLIASGDISGVVRSNRHHPARVFVVVALHVGDDFCGVRIIFVSLDDGPRALDVQVYVLCAHTLVLRADTVCRIRQVVGRIERDRGGIANVDHR